MQTETVWRGRKEYTLLAFVLVAAGYGGLPRRQWMGGRCSVV